MIPGKFDYHRPRTKADLLHLLRDAGEEARPLAGGHSLIPMMKLRMSSPSALIDLMHVAELQGINIGVSTIDIGATTTQHELIASEELHKACPIIREAALLIADPQIRYCGTIGGNVANGDPGNDMPGLMQCLGATYLLESTKGKRRVPARDFYRSAYFTSLEPGEVLTRIEFQRPPVGHGFAYTKLKRKVGDYATAAAAVIIEMGGGTVKSACIGLTNVAETPLFAAEAAKSLVGTRLETADIARAVTAAEAITRPASDGRGSSEYRTKMAGVMLRRALEKAKSRAGEAKPSGTNSGGVFGWLRR